MNKKIKTVPNQKVVRIKKETCDSNNKYAMINIEAVESAAQDLQAGAFKLWIYFAKNRNDFTFALSSDDVKNTFGIKIKQYNNAIDELIEKGYLVITKGNNYEFNETPVITKEDNHVITKSNNDVITKEDNTLLPKVIRNNTYNTYNNTINNTEEGQKEEVIEMPSKWFIEHYNELIATTEKGIYLYKGKKYRKIKEEDISNAMGWF